VAVLVVVVVMVIVVAAAAVVVVVVVAAAAAAVTAVVGVTGICLCWKQPESPTFPVTDQVDVVSRYS
jgi:hypothetical protein